MAQHGDPSTTHVDVSVLSPFVSELALEWDLRHPGVTTQQVFGTLVFADVSGFTKLTERLAANGRFGAEEISDHLDLVLSGLLDAAYRLGGRLVKWGGDALLLIYDGHDHARRACAGAAAMRSTMTQIGLLQTSVGRVRLRMSVGVHTGRFDLTLVGSVHRELLITGRSATVTARLEATAEAGEILVSPQTASRLPEHCRGAAKSDGVLLARTPAYEGPDARPLPTTDPTGLMPELVVAHLRAGGGSGEHRPVAVGFLEFGGLSRRVQRGDRHSLADSLGHVVETTQEACRRYHVSFHETDISPDGGKIMLVAGAPLGLDDPAEAMLCTVREVLDDPGSLTLRAGVTVGRVFSGCVGPAYRRSYSVKGDVVNLAARIMGKTPPGEIWALPAVTDASRTKFSLHAIEPFAVKGKVAPVVVSAVGPALQRTHDIADIPLIARAEEIVCLDFGIAQARAGSGSCIEVLGAPGMGKTRLLAEARTRAEGMTVIAAAGEPFRSGSAYAVIRPLLIEVLGLSEVPRHALPEALERWCREHAADLLPWLPLVGPVLQVELSPTPQTADLAREFRAQRLRDLVLDLFAAAMPTPSLIVVDDVQFADPASTDVLRHLAANAQEHPWLVIMAERRIADAATQGAVNTMVLTALVDESAFELLYADTEDDPPTPHIADAIVELAAGNPFFLRQLARTSSSATSVAELPDSIETMVSARIDALRPAAREVLRASAVIGMAVDRGLLRELLGDERSAEETDEAVSRLREFVEDSGPILRFRQAVLRDTAYEGLPYRRRAALHGRLAELLDERAAGADTGASLRSLHHFRAGNFGSAFRLSRLGGDAAASAHANVEAVKLYQQAAESARHLPTTTAHVRAELMERLGDAQGLLGEYEDSDASYAEARRLLRGDHIHGARIEMKAARSASQRGDYKRTLQRLTRIQRLLADTTDPASHGLRLEARLRSAFTQFRQGRVAAARLNCRYVLDHADKHTSEDVVADALGLLDVIEMSLGIPTDGSRSRRALRLYDRLEGLVGQARMYNQIGYTAYLNGRWDDAVASYQQAQEIYQRLGDLPNAAVNDANVAEVLLDQGRSEEAEVTLRRAVRIWRSCGADNDVAFGLALLGRTLARQSKCDEAEELLNEARQQFIEQGAATEVIDVDAYLSECLLAAGRHRDALDRAQAALVDAHRLAGEPPRGPLLYRVIGACYDALGDAERADDAFATSLELGRRRHADHEVTFTIAAMAARAKQRGDRIDAALIREAIPMQRRLGVIIDLTAPDDAVRTASLEDLPV